MFGQKKCRQKKGAKNLESETDKWPMGPKNPLKEKNS